MTDDLHRRVSRRIGNFLTNRKSPERVAAEVIAIIAQAIEAQRAETTQIGSVHESAVPQGMRP